jgi:hypothetical protein
MKFSDLISVAPRYARSINVERDGFTATAVDGYVVTSTAEDFLLRFGRSVVGYDPQRAWTLTGPYGAGKSSFALFLANLFGPASAEGSKSARKILKEQHPETYTELFDRGGKEKLGKQGFAPVVVSGAPEPLLQALVRAVIRDIGPHFSHGRKPDALKELDSFEALLSSSDRNQVTTTLVVNCILRLCANLVATGRTRGILIVIDELGKFLEFAARSQESSELFVLQQLAESTVNSKSSELFLVTILHQAFERYAAELRPAVRDEWAKVQGRFEDVAFQEPPEQLLELISRAIVVKTPSHPAMRMVSQKAKALAQKAVELDLAPRGMGAKAFARALERCAPLHPLSALALVRLCRKFGQNQRSLFSFLTSQEPHGFSSFLQTSAHSGRTFGLCDLYDYLAEGLGSGLAVGESAARWAEIQASLDRASAASPREIEFIKTVGILSAVGQLGNLKASPELLEFALDMEHQEFRRNRISLSERSLIIDRKHSGTIALWEGSDIDLDEEVRSASGQLPTHSSLAEKLNSLWGPRPLVAKRHSFRTGTLRYFSVRFADVVSIGKKTELEPGADGLLLYCLPTNHADFEALCDLAQNTGLRDKRELLIAIPTEVAALRDAIQELEVLRHVQIHTRQLQGDAVARRELRARIAAAESRVSSEVQRLFVPEELTAKQTVWFHHGIRQKIPTSRTLADFLSAICNVVYDQTPVLQNELINRRALSSAAAAARRNLIEAMISKQSEPFLGFTGTPPEVSIYSSVLAATGIHRLESGAWVFGPPRDENAALGKVWREITKFFETCEQKKHTVSDLFAILQRGPYGLKSGVIPILFCAAALAHDTEIAFYENAAFLPELTTDAFERLIKSPDRFELRRYRIEGVRREVYIELAHLFGRPISGKANNLMSVMKPLFRFLYRLPKYCQDTRRLSPRTIEVRAALMHAKEPDKLVFEDLPVACGFEKFSPDQEDPQTVRRFFGVFKASIAELQRAYEDLLRDLQALVFRAFDQDDRKKLAQRLQPMAPYCVEPRLKAFVTHLANSETDDLAWIEMIATTLTGKAPKSWSDDDRIRFEISLSESSRNVRHLEALLYEEQKRIADGACLDEVFRIGVADRQSMEVGAVVAVDKHDRRDFEATVIGIEAKIASLNTRPELALAALASVSKKLLVELSEAHVVAVPGKEVIRVR